MKCCPACHASITADNACPACGYRAGTHDGFELYAPAAAHAGNGYDPALYHDLAALEDANFWFRARNRLIVHALRRYCGAPATFLEIGCGTGEVLRAITAAFPAMQASGSELFVEGLAFARQRLPQAHLMQMDATALPFAEEFDAIGAFDVIEHIADDERVLGEVHRALQPRGHAIFTVPQHPWLWSRQDEIAHHERRYRVGELERKLVQHGFKVVYSTSFVSVLLPLLVLSRRIIKPAATDPFREMRIGRVPNAILGAALHLEYLLLCCGVRLPLGGSRLVVAAKET